MRELGDCRIDEDRIAVDASPRHCAKLDDYQNSIRLASTTSNTGS
jgi:hypothetical protein